MMTLQLFNLKARREKTNANVERRKEKLVHIILALGLVEECGLAVGCPIHRSGLNTNVFKREPK